MSYGSVDDMMFDEKRMGRDIQSGHDEEDGIEGAKFDKDLHNRPQWSENKRLHQLCKGDILLCRRPAPASAGGRSKSSASTSSSSKRTRGGGEKGADWGVVAVALHDVYRANGTSSTEVLMRVKQLDPTMDLGDQQHFTGSPLTNFRVSLTKLCVLIIYNKATCSIL